MRSCLPELIVCVCVGNYHIAYITAASNMRARCYSIEEETFLQTKLTAGKIIPAIATTTTTVSAAVIIELIKIVQKRPLNSFKTLYLDLALPVFTHYTPWFVNTNISSHQPVTFYVQ